MIVIHPTDRGAVRHAPCCVRFDKMINPRRGYMRVMCEFVRGSDVCVCVMCAALIGSNCGCQRTSIRMLCALYSLCVVARLQKLRALKLAFECI